MPKRKRTEISLHKSKKVKLNIDITEGDHDINVDEIDIPELTGINLADIENTIYKVISENNISRAKAKHLIREMLKHPNVVEWFKNVFNYENKEFQLSYEPRITRSSKSNILDSQFNNKDVMGANFVGRLLLSGRTINDCEFDNDENDDCDYTVDLDQEEVSSDSNDEKELKSQVKLSPYKFRSRGSTHNLEVDLLDDSILTIESSVSAPVESNSKLTMEEFDAILDMDLDDKLYEEFKQSLFNNNNNTSSIQQSQAIPISDIVDDEEDPEFDIMREITDGTFDNDLYEDCRYDRSAKVSRSEMWALWKDNKLVEGNKNTINYRKTFTILCNEEDASNNNNIVPITDENENCYLQMIMTPQQTERMGRQIVMCYQQLATIFMMLFDQPHLSIIIEHQIKAYIEMINCIPFNLNFNPNNREFVEKILKNYRGLTQLPSLKFSRTTQYKRIDLPNCLKATFIGSGAFPYPQLFPEHFRIFNPTSPISFRTQSFLESEDNLMTHGIILFSNQSHKMFSLINKYIFPIRSPEQLRYRRSNLLRRVEFNDQQPANVVELYQFPHFTATNPMRCLPRFAAIPMETTSIWFRLKDWQYLPELYLNFLKRFYPDMMLSVNLISKDEYYQLSKSLTSQYNRVLKKPDVFCNWSSMPWENCYNSVITTGINTDINVNSTYNFNKGKFNRIQLNKSKQKLSQKIQNKNSFPQYVVSDNPYFHELINKWKNQVELSRLNKINKSQKFLVASKKIVEKSKRFLRKYKLAQTELEKKRNNENFGIKNVDDSISKLNKDSAKDNCKSIKPTNFQMKLEKFCSSKDKKTSIFQRFTKKCQESSNDFEDKFMLHLENKDEKDLKFCRDLLDNLHCKLNEDGYEQFLAKIMEFQQYTDSNLFDNSPEDNILQLIESLLGTVKSQIPETGINHSFEDLLSLLTPEQALSLGYDLQIKNINNINLAYIIINRILPAPKGKFWSRLSNMFQKFEKGQISSESVVQNLLNSLKNYPYTQLVVKGLLNSWQEPVAFDYSQCPDSFCEINTLSSDKNLAQFHKDSANDSFDYCTKLQEPSKLPCPCSCHDGKDNSTKHCYNCGFKVINGSIYFEEGKFQKNLHIIEWPKDFVPKNSNFKPKISFAESSITEIVNNVVNIDNTNTESLTDDNISVVKFVNSNDNNTISSKNLQNRTIVIRDLVSERKIQDLLRQSNAEILTGSANDNDANQDLFQNTSINLNVDSDEAMDETMFRQIKGLPKDNNQKVSVSDFSNINNHISDNKNSVIKFYSQMMNISVISEDNRKNLTDSEWTSDDDRILLNYFQNIKPTQESFANIKKLHFPHRTVNQLQTHFNALFQQILEFNSKNSDCSDNGINEEKKNN